MQSLPTPTLYAGINTLGINFIIQSEPPFEGLPQLRRAHIVSIVTDTYHNLNITDFLAYLLCFCWLHQM